jgi:hypothetical protein
MGKVCSTHGRGKRNAYRVLVGKPEGKRHRWEDNVKMDLRKVGWGDVDRIHLAHDS